jgi:hypothetical protein
MTKNETIKKFVNLVENVDSGFRVMLMHVLTAVRQSADSEAEIIVRIRDGAEGFDIVLDWKSWGMPESLYKQASELMKQHVPASLPDYDPNEARH